MHPRLLILTLSAFVAIVPSALGVAQINVDVMTGAIELTNASGSNLELAGYAILSESNSLENTNWKSIATRYDANDGGEVDPVNNWFFLANSDSEFAEATLGWATIAPGQIIDLGTGAFRPGGVRDLVLEYVDATTRSTELGFVIYRSDVSFMADFDSDGDVDGDDFLTWQANFGITSFADRSVGDANGDGAVNGDDFLIWQTEFGSAVAGLGGTTPVPEPQTSLLVLVFLLGCSLLGCGGWRAAGRK